MPRVSPKVSQAMETLLMIAEDVGWIFARHGSLAGIGYTRDTWQALQAEREYYFKLGEKRRQLRYLREQKLIESRRVGERLEMKLTHKGWCALSKALMRRAAEREGGDLCIIVYDVPHSERALRRMLQRFLRECGFKRLQKSVWMTRKDVARLFQAFIVESKLTEWIQVIEGRVI